MTAARKTSAKPKSADAKPSAPVIRAVQDGEIMPVAELQRRLGWGVHALRQARRRGLRVIRLGRQAFVLGADVLKFFESLADQQAGDP